MINVKFCELHAPLFLNGKNFQTKLDPDKIHGLELCYDEDKERMIATYQDMVAVIPDVHYFIPADPKEIGINKPKPKMRKDRNDAGTMDLNKIKAAQVSTPHDAVFGGPGAGRTKDK